MPASSPALLLIVAVVVTDEEEAEIVRNSGQPTMLIVFKPRKVVLGSHPVVHPSPDSPKQASLSVTYARHASKQSIMFLPPQKHYVRSLFTFCSGRLRYQNHNGRIILFTYPLT